MKEILKQMATYNQWANKKLADILLALPEEKLHENLPSSFASLHKTLLHMWDAGSIWWQRMKLQERVNIPSYNFNGNTTDIVHAILQLNQQWLDWINAASEPSLDHVFAYYNSKRELFKQPVFQMLVHVFNHETYHRGQLVNMLRQLKIEKIPQTDFIVWARRK